MTSTTVTPITAAKKTSAKKAPAKKATAKAPVKAAPKAVELPENLLPEQKSMIEWTIANPGQVQWAFQGESGPVKVERLVSEWSYFVFFVDQLAMIKEASAANGWDISHLSDREIHLQVWRTRSTEGAVKKFADFLGVEAPKAAKVEKAVDQES